MPTQTADPWRLRCPEGHSAWSPKGDHYWCETCGELFDELTDAKREAADD